MNIEKSDIVISLNGRDEGRRFLVIETEEQYALLADGKMRRLEKPKRKKSRHVKRVAKGVCQTSDKIRSGEKVTNNEIRKALAVFTAVEAVGEKGGM